MKKSFPGALKPSQLFKLALFLTSFTIRTSHSLFKLTSFNNYPLGDGHRLVKVVSLNDIQPVLSHICDNSP